MNGEIETNKVFLQGIVDSEPEYNHSVKDEEFYTFNLKVLRLSGQNDIIPITISKKFLEENDIKKDDEIEIICEGVDEVEALAEMIRIIEDGLGE